MIIPAFFEELLARDRSLQAEVGMWLVHYETCMNFSHVPFFGDYTDHGPEHVSRVLAASDRLISQSARNSLTAADAAVLILAVLLHDAALHISEDGFRTLMHATSCAAIPEFDQKTWMDLWRDYLAEAMRWDSRRRFDILGWDCAVSEPKHNEEYSAHEKRLIGEFLRRHHPRIAHEAALQGLPGVNTTIRPPGSSLAKHYCQLAGIVARSHGVPLRSTYSYLANIAGVSESGPRLRSYFSVSVEYLMVLLRIADYLEIDYSRAPAAVRHFRSIRSPVSLREWDAHAAIHGIDDLLDDNEAIFIHAKPLDARTYVKLRRLLDSIQSELDASWAALGEVYGRAAPNLGITLRRVRSSLDDEVAFQTHAGFLAREVYFRSSGSDLLKLLIAPLYGSKPEVGIRELMQNAVDAVWSLGNYPNISHCVNVSADRNVASPDVTISIDTSTDGDSWLTVADHGLGMDADTICNYFLTAGATIRKSEEWRLIHTNAAGHTDIPFTGRFGIGLLAGFILGSEIHVRTRHAFAKASEGYDFSATLQDDLINVRRVTAPAGTTIRIRLSEFARARLCGTDNTDQFGNAGAGEFSRRGPALSVPSTAACGPTLWDWYCFEKPSVAYLINGAKLPQRWNVPGPGTCLPNGWRRLKCEPHFSVDWTYGPAPGLACNGFRVIDETLRDAWSGEYIGVPLRVPQLSVFDPDGDLPLTIRRDQLQTKSVPFAGELLDDVLRDYLLRALEGAPAKGVTHQNDAAWFFSPNYPGINISGEPPSAFWLSSERGWFPTDVSILAALKLQYLVVVPYVLRRSVIDRFGQRVATNPTLALASRFTILPVPVWASSNDLGLIDGLLSICGPSPMAPNAIQKIAPDLEFPLLSSYRIIGNQVITSRNTFNEQRGSRARMLLADQMRLEPHSSGLEIWHEGHCRNSHVAAEIVAHISETVGSDWSESLSVWHLEPREAEFRKSRLANIWQRVFGDVVGIPYEKSKRDGYASILSGVI